MNPRRSSTPVLALSIIPFAIVATMVAHLATRSNDLPNPMASHWGFGGQPDGSMSPTLFTLIPVALIVAIGWSALSAIRSESNETASFLAMFYGLAGVLGYAHWSGIEANVGAPSWDQANEATLLNLVIALSAGILFGMAGWLIGRKTTGSQPNDPTRETLHLEPGQQAVWISSAANPVLAGLGVAVIVGAVITWGTPSPAIALIGLVLLWSSQVRVTASNSGVTIGLGPLAWPSKTLPLSGLNGAESVTVAPFAYGGWGYRFRPGVRALIVRGGEGIRLRRTDKADLIVTVPFSDQGARLVNTLTDRVGTSK